MDNIIEWIFEKAFDQLTMNGKELYVTPFKTIYDKTYGSEELYAVISKLNGRQVECIKSYLTDVGFQRRHLFDKLKKRINVEILFSDRILELIELGYKPDVHSLQLAVVNNSLQAVRILVSKGQVLTGDLLALCAEFGYEDLYFYLRSQDLVPNISVYDKAVLGKSVKIVKDVSYTIGMSHKTLETSFQTNHTEIIEFLLETAPNENIKVKSNLISYPIMNNNMYLVQKMVTDESWVDELYYSAILSGSMEMIEFVESHMPDIHVDRKLDTSKTHKGQQTLLVEDMIYVVNKKKYFSHTMNYAVQSKSLQVIKYIHSKGYGITVSNIITAICQSTNEVLKYVLDLYKKELPGYVIYYLGINSIVRDKEAKIKTVAGRINFKRTGLSVNDYRKENTHLEIISQQKQHLEEGIFDTDFLMNYNMFFTPLQGYKSNNWLITVCKFHVINDSLDKLNLNGLNTNDKQHITDCVYLFGELNQFKEIYQKLFIVPSLQIIMETLCYGQFAGLAYVYQQQKLSSFMINNIKNLVYLLNDTLVTDTFNRLVNGQISGENKIKFIIMSKNKNQIIDLLQSMPDLPKNMIKELLLMSDVEIMKLCKIKKDDLQELIEWTEDRDLLEMKIYLKGL